MRGINTSRINKQRIHSHSHIKKQRRRIRLKTVQQHLVNTRRLNKQLTGPSSQNRITVKHHQDSLSLSVCFMVFARIHPSISINKTADPL